MISSKWPMFRKYLVVVLPPSKLHVGELHANGPDHATDLQLRSDLVKTTRLINTTRTRVNFIGRTDQILEMIHVNNDVECTDLCQAEFLREPETHVQQHVLLLDNG